MKSAAVLQIAVALALASCSGQQPPSPTPNDAGGFRMRPGTASSPITHVVIIVQENRTPDYLFQGVPGADIATKAVDSQGQTVPLHSVSLAAGYDLGHGHDNFVTDYDGGKMDGFDKGLPQKYHLRPFAYAPLTEVQPYFDMATQYVFADRMFQSNQAGSFPAHQYFVSGTAAALPATSFNVSSDPYDSRTGKKGSAGCDAAPSTIVYTINPNDGSPGPTPFPCFERPVLSDFLDQKGVTWRYYQHGLGTGLWHAFDAIQHVRYGPDYANVVTPPQTILTDISNSKLAQVSWVMPADDAHSDHPGTKQCQGPVVGRRRRQRGREKLVFGIQRPFSSFGTIGEDGTTTILLPSSTTTTSWGAACRWSSYRRTPSAATCRTSNTSSAASWRSPKRRSASPRVRSVRPTCVPTTCAMPSTFPNNRGSSSRSKRRRSTRAARIATSRILRKRGETRARRRSRFAGRRIRKDVPLRRDRGRARPDRTPSRGEDCRFAFSA